MRRRCLMALVSPAPPLRGAAVVIVLLAASACAARGTALPTLEPEPESGGAAALVREGCYRCLEQALEIYERVAEAPWAPASTRRAAFETAVLLATRARELGIAAEPMLDRARRHAVLLPPAVSPAVPASAYLDAADLIVGELSGLDPEVRRQRSARLRPSGLDAERPPSRVALAAAPRTDLVAAYLSLAIDCQDARARRDVNVDAVLARHGDSPLIRFRLALCPVSGASPGALREENPRWLDTLFFEGRAELGRRPVADVAKVVELLTAAREAFPESPAIVLALGNAQNALSAYELALANFDAVIATTPTQREALLGRVVSLSYLSRHSDAIAAATRLIDLGTWLIGDAYYWRAWNRYHVYELDAAWSDVEAASKSNLDTAVFTLAGFVAYARKEPDTAVNRFDRAFELDPANCEAVWMSGVVHVDQQRWGEAAPKFSRGMTCFTSAAEQAAVEIAETERASYAETLKARRKAAAEKRLETARFRSAQSAFNAAQCYVRLGEKAFARTHVDVAADHEQLKEKAAALRATIEKMPW
jgi:tetratricopeptide (TPR) repeat protein